MAEVVVNYLIERLLEFGRENVDLIVGVEDEVRNLVGDLQGLKAFLKDASQINRRNEAWKATVKDIRSVVYKAEDAIDKFLLDAKQHQVKNKAIKWIDVPYWFNVRNVAKEIQSIRTRVNDVRSQNQHLLEANQLGNIPTTTSQPREQTLSDEDDVVGFDEAAKTLIGRLLGGSEDLEAVPIVGMAGLGKSTLARKVFKDSDVNFEFFSCIWVSVSQDYRKKDVLLNILTSFTKRTSEIESKNEDQLSKAIREFIENGGRCLIVLDDVWDGEVMDFIKPIFPKNRKGHRIMVTTRHENVASSFNENFYQQEFLSDENSLLLLKKKVFRRESCPSEFEEPGKAIAKRCSGLPLAIVVIAGALVGSKTKREWQLVNQNIGNLLINRDDPKSCLGFVKMSYDLLSYYQKACFLYCASFPRGFDIPAWKLIRLWIAEGFIPSQTLTLEELAEFCLNDLTKKSLVMVMKRTSDGQIRTCRIHDMLYEFCKTEASEEDIFQEVKKATDDQSLTIQDSDICRRLCIDSSILYDFLGPLAKKPMENVRSFLCHNSKQTEMSTAVVKSLHKGFPLIKVLDVAPIKFVFSKEFYQLLHLKYISFSGDFKGLPDQFSKFWNLETLIIHTTTHESTFDIKADIWSMLRLRHLHSNVPAILPSPSTSTSRESCIQTLSTVSPQSCTKKVFAKARYLRKLGIRGQVASLFDTNASGLNELAKLKMLENLKLVNDNRYASSKFITLPAFIFPKTLRKLTFSGTQLEWSEMTKLGQLESLEVLKLKENAFKGDFWEPEIGGFSSLLVLWIERTDLKTWRASSRNFPSLKRLILIACENLQLLPESLADIPDLQEMKLENTHKAAVKLAREIERKKQETIREEMRLRAQETTLERPANFCHGFKLSVFPPDTDADSKSTD